MLPNELVPRSSPSSGRYSACSGALARLSQANRRRSPPGCANCFTDWESTDLDSSAKLQLHVTDRVGDPLCVFTYGPARIQKSPYAVWPRIGFRLQTRSTIIPALVEGYLPLAAVRAAANVDGVQALHATQRPFTHAGLVPSQAVPYRRPMLSRRAASMTYTNSAAIDAARLDNIGLL